MEQISYDDFKKVEIRTGTIIQVEKHPNADRLLVLQVDVGEDQPRQIVAGLAKAFPEFDTTLVGWQGLFVLNLAPANLRGVISNGMILAANDLNLGLVLPTCPATAGVKVG